MFLLDLYRYYNHTECVSLLYNPVHGIVLQMNTTVEHYSWAWPNCNCDWCYPVGKCDVIDRASLHAKLQILLHGITAISLYLITEYDNIDCFL